MIQSEAGPRFDARVLDYRIDVDNVLKKFHPAEVLAVLLVNRDGLTHAEAIQVSGIRTSIEDIEISMGQAFAFRRLDNFLDYVDHLR